MINFLTETRSDIKKSGHNVKDIIFIGSKYSGYSCTWKEFKVLANVEYDNGYGSQIVASDLIIIFSDGSSMRRNEYDGAESWEYIASFVMPKETKVITRLLVNEDRVGWCTLEEINKEDM